MRKKRIPKMKNAIPMSEKAPFKKKHVLQAVVPSLSKSGENEQNWHNCDHMSGGGGN
jgi:hypothetical protein